MKRGRPSNHTTLDFEKNTIRHSFYRPAGPPTLQLMNGHLECRTCSRMPCVFSQADYSAHCCPLCAETNGKKHLAGCDAGYKDLQSRAINAPDVGDLVDVFVEDGVILGRVVSVFGDKYRIQPNGAMLKDWLAPKPTQEFDCRISSCGGKLETI